MPTVAELERLAALAKALTPLTSVRAGTLIRAEDWNTVVGALVELARAVLSSTRESAVPPHEHADQVSIGWLDAQLRFLIERGPLADPSATSRVDELGRKLEALRGALERTGNDVREVRERVTDVATRDLARQADVTSVRRTVEGLADGREDVLGLRKTLASVQGDVRTAIEAVSRFTVDGQPIDGAALVGRVSELETLRDRLRRPDGSLLDAAALELRLTELTNTLVTEAELDEALKSRSGGLSADQIAGLRDQIGNSVLEQARAGDDRVTNSLRGEIAQQLGQVDALVSRAVADAVPGARDAAIGAVRPEIAASVLALRGDVETLVGRRLEETAGALREETRNALTDLQRTIGPAVTQELERQLTSTLTDVRGSLDGLGRRVAALDERATAHDRELARVGTRIEDVARADAAARDELRAGLSRDMDRRLGEFQNSVDQKMGSLRDDLLSRIDQGIRGARADLEGALRNAALEAAQRAVADLSTQLRGEMAATAQDAVAGLQDRLSQQVDDQVTRKINEQVPGISEGVRTALAPQIASSVKDSVRQQVGNLPNLITSLRPVLQEMVKRQVDERLPR